MAFVTSLLNALAAIPTIAGYVDRVIQAIITWYVARQNQAALAAIADAAAMAARASTDEERYAAAQAWHDALSKPRVSSS